MKSWTPLTEALGHLEASVDPVYGHDTKQTAKALLILINRDFLADSVEALKERVARKKSLLAAAEADLATAESAIAERLATLAAT